MNYFSGYFFVCWYICMWTRWVVLHICNWTHECSFPPLILHHSCFPLLLPLHWKYTCKSHCDWSGWWTCSLHQYLWSSCDIFPGSSVLSQLNSSPLGISLLANLLAVIHTTLWIIKNALKTRYPEYYRKCCHCYFVHLIREVRS